MMNIRLFIVVWSITRVVESLAYQYPQCSASSELRCMDETRINCVNNTESENSDRWCCPGLTCLSLTIPSTDTQTQYMTNQCVNSSISHNTQNLNVKKLTDLNLKLNIKKPTPIPPILPLVWKALNTTSYNMSDDTFSNGSIYFNQNYNGIRVDYYPTCAFLQLWNKGIDSNYVPCSVLFYEEYNYYIYDTYKICCKYKFPSWKNNYLCSSNATYGGEHYINNNLATLWEVEWFSNFTGEGPVRNIRNTYIKTDSNMPVRFLEDLDTGYTDFNEVILDDVPKSVFEDIINKYECHDGWHPIDNPNDKTCTRYNSQTLRRSWPCPTPTCNV